MTSRAVYLAAVRVARWKASYLVVHLICCILKNSANIHGAESPITYMELDGFYMVLEAVYLGLFYTEENMLVLYLVD